MDDYKKSMATRDGYCIPKKSKKRKSFKAKSRVQNKQIKEK